MQRQASPVLSVEQTVAVTTRTPAGAAGASGDAGAAAGTAVGGGSGNGVVAGATGVGPAVELLRVNGLVRHLAHDGEIVEGAGEIRVQGTMTGFLQFGRLAQQ